jgi:hypothetical protein
VAKLTDVIGTNMSGKDIQQPYDKGPSIWEGIADVVGVGADIVGKFVGMDQQRDANRDRKAAAAAKADETAAENEVAQGMLDIGSGAAAASAAAQQPAGQPVQTAPAPTPLTKLEAPASTTPTDVTPLTQGDLRETAAATADATAVGQRLSTLQTGVKQGRISSSTYELQAEAMLRRVFAAHPNAKYAAYKAFDAIGIDSPIMSEWRTAEKLHQAEVDGEASREQKLIDKAVLERGYDPDVYDKPTLIKLGRAAVASEYDFKHKEEIYDANRKRAKDNQEDLDRFNSAHDIAMDQWLTAELAPQLGASNDVAHSFLSSTSIDDATKLKAYGEFLDSFISGSHSTIDFAITKAKSAGMSPTAAEAARQRLYAQADQAFLPLSQNNPLSVLQRDSSIKKVLTDKIGLNALEAMPVYTAFKQAFGNSDMVQTVVDTIASDPKLTSAFTREMKGFTALGDPGKQTMRIRNFMAVMAGNTDLRELSPDEAAQVLKDSQVLFNKGFYKTALAGDSGAQHVVLNTLGKAANAAVELNKGSETETLMRASAYIANAQSLAVLNNLNPDQHDFGNIVADEMRVATQNNLVSLIQQRKSDAYHRVDFQNGRFVLKETGKTTQGWVPGQSGREGAGRVENFVPAPSPALTKQVNAMNNNLNFLLETTKFEDTPFLKTASRQEKIAFYTTGTLPASARPKPGEKQDGVKTLSSLQNFWANAQANLDWKSIPPVNIDQRTADRSGVGGGTDVQINDDGSRQGPSLSGKPINIPSPEAIRDRQGDNPVYQSIINQAGKLGIPVGVAVRLGHVETGGQFNNPGPNKAGAQGPLQVTGKNHDDRAQRMFGKNVSQLTADENIAVGLDYFKELHDKYGSWEEAALHYIGTGQADKSVGEANDGNVKSRVYAELIGRE